MGIKDIGFEDSRYGMNGFGEFMQEDEEYFETIHGGFMSDMSGYETEPTVAGQKNNKSNNQMERYKEKRRRRFSI